LLPEFFDVRCSGVDIERRAIDQFERPGPHSNSHVCPTELAPAPNNSSQPYVGERAPDVGIHLDD
jgi:hypothetical protein